MYYLQVYIVLLGFCMGFCMYSAISLLSIIAVEVATIHTTGAAHAIVGAASNCKFLFIIFILIF